MQKVIQFRDAYLDSDFNLTAGQFQGEPVLRIDHYILSNSMNDHKSINDKRAENYHKYCSGQSQ